MDFIKVKKLCTSNDTKYFCRNTTEWDSIFVDHIYLKDLCPECIKNTLPAHLYVYK